MQIPSSDLVLIGSGLASLGTIVVMFVRLTWFLSKEFEKSRRLMYSIRDKTAARILRLEYWAVGHGFQPGADPLEWDWKNSEELPRNGDDSTH